PSGMTFFSLALERGEEGKEERGVHHDEIARFLCSIFCCSSESRKRDEERGFDVQHPGRRRLEGRNPRLPNHRFKYVRISSKHPNFGLLMTRSALPPVAPHGIPTNNIITEAWDNFRSGRVYGDPESTTLCGYRCPGKANQPISLNPTPTQPPQLYFDTA